MTRAFAWRAVFTTLGTLVLALAVVVALFLFAARNFVASTSHSGVAGSALQGWSIRPGAQPFGQVVPGFDLASQAGMSDPELVLVSALNSAFLIVIATGLAIALGV